MNDTLYLEETRLEEEARGLSIQRFHRDHLKASEEDTFGDTFLGKNMVKNYLLPVADGVKDWLRVSNSGAPGRRARASILLEGVDPFLVAFLTIKAIIHRVGTYQEGKHTNLTQLATYTASLIHDEIRLQEFEASHKRLSARIHTDFDKRELPRHKREEYMRKAFERADMEWDMWSTTDRVHVGMALVGIFKDVTGDIETYVLHNRKREQVAVRASLGLLQAIELAADHCEAMFSTYFPMVIPPTDWGVDTLNSGAYISGNLRPYPLVKSSRRGLKDILRQRVSDGELDRVLSALNALQRTPWAVNTRVLDALENVYDRNIHCGKLPRSDSMEPDPPPASLEGLEPDHPDVKAYRAYRFGIHENNRRVIGKRVMAKRAFHLARKFSTYDAIYFPHDLDSRGRAYPKPSGLNPQGPDYVKGLLRFATGKALTSDGVYWLGVHGANCFGEDKLPLDERAAWAVSHLDIARSVAARPLEDLSWTKADNPAQYLAWCFEWAEAHTPGEDPEAFVSYLHVDLDATCSGLQHFAAMLRDEVGGFHVNMTPNDVRQDVYGAVAAEAARLIAEEEDPDKVQLSAAWRKFGVTRKITKRPVMVKPYSGTRNSCVQYVSDAVTEIIAEGSPMPWPKDGMWDFKLYGADKVWKAIPVVVVAADEAMKWLSDIARKVGRSQPEMKRIEWNTPLGFPVHQYKFDTSLKQVRTKFDGMVFKPSILEDKDTLNARQMGSSVAPSFVHSLDACHLQATISAALDIGLSDFAAVHDSFGVHACDIPRFSRVIREQFVEMYEGRNVLDEFLQMALPLMTDELAAEVLPIPEMGSLDLRGILQNEFFFS